MSSIAFGFGVPVGRRGGAAALRGGAGCVAPSQTPRLAKWRMQEFSAKDLPGPDAGNHPLLQQATERTIKDYLARRAVKTVAFYMFELHDGAARDWLLKFDDFEAKDRAKSFSNGEAFLTKMLTAPSQDCTIVFAHPRGYFRREFHYKIHPFDIAHRILAARAQLAEEFSTDLRLIHAENQEINRQHLEKLVTTSQRERDRTRALILDHDVFSGSTTPYRAANYTQFKLILTDLAMRRALTRYREEAAHHYLWLGEYSHCNRLTDGDGFIAELLTRPPQQRSNPDVTISPMEVGMDLMRYRVIIANEWIEALRNVPEENLGLERDVLENSFKAVGEEKNAGSAS